MTKAKRAKILLRHEKYTFLSAHTLPIGPTNCSVVILSTSKCFKMTPYALKMHLESIKLQQ
jgi:hypothetical protein